MSLLVLYQNRRFHFTFLVNKISGFRRIFRNLVYYYRRIMGAAGRRRVHTHTHRFQNKNEPRPRVRTMAGETLGPPGRRQTFGD